MTDIELLKGLDTEIPGWVLQSRLTESGYVNRSRRGQTYTFDIFTYFTQLTQLRRSQIGSLVSN